MLALMEIVTTEHTDSNGEIVYLTRFGGIDKGYIGQCNYDPDRFLADYDSTGDFSMADTFEVNWNIDTYGNKLAVGLNFLKSADSQVLGVPNDCLVGIDPPVQITSASHLTLDFGFSLS